MNRLIFTLLMSLWAGLTGLTAAETPNVIVIMADDLGYGDLSIYGGRVATPAIDRLAVEGRRFTSGYCSASTCTPSRYSLLTGTYAFRVPGTGIAAPNAAALISPETVTLPSLLKQAGYATAIVGKWHLGLGVGRPDWNGELKPGPCDIGFDHCLILPTTNDRVPQVFVQDRRVRNLDANDPLWVGEKIPSPDHPTGQSHRHTLKLDWDQGHNGTIHNGISRIGFYTGGHQARFRDEDLADEWIRESRHWIDSHRAEPFFLFFASHDIHVPRVPHERFQGKSGQGPRGDCILEFDACVGELTRIIEQLGLKEKTMIIVCSDNGPVLNDGYKDQAVEKVGEHQPAGPYRGGKYSVYEGGTRTPFIIHWPGRIAPSVSDEIVCTIDLPATLAALTGQSLPPEACRDSLDLRGVFLGETGARGRDHLVQQDNGGGNFGLRDGHWKLVRQKLPARAVRQAKSMSEALPAFQEQLFDLSRDPGEQTNVAAQHPEVLSRLRDRLDAIIRDDRTRQHIP